MGRGFRNAVKHRRCDECEKSVPGTSLCLFCNSCKDGCCPANGLLCACGYHLENGQCPECNELISGNDSDNYENE